MIEWLLSLEYLAVSVIFAREVDIIYAQILSSVPHLLLMELCVDIINILLTFATSMYISEAHSNPSQTYKIAFYKKVNGFHLLTIVAKSSILDVWLSSECVSTFYY